MTAQALGFARGPRAIRVISHPAAPTDRRARLRACLDAWRAHSAFLPLPLNRPVPLAEASRFAEAHADALTAQLDALTGAAEALIAVHLPPQPDTAGRVWLHARAARAAIPHTLETFAQQLDHARAHTVHAGDLSLLVDRADLSGLRGEIAAKAPDLQAHLPPGARLHVTLPWPPFSFAHLDPTDP